MCVTFQKLIIRHSHLLHSVTGQVCGDGKMESRFQLLGFKKAVVKLPFYVVPTATSVTSHNYKQMQCQMPSRRDTLLAKVVIMVIFPKHNTGQTN